MMKVYLVVLALNGQLYSNMVDYQVQDYCVHAAMMTARRYIEAGYKNVETYCYDPNTKKGFNVISPRRKQVEVRSWTPKQPDPRNDGEGDIVGGILGIIGALR